MSLIPHCSWILCLVLSTMTELNIFYVIQIQKCVIVINSLETLWLYISTLLCWCNRRNGELWQLQWRCQMFCFSQMHTIIDKINILTLNDTSFLISSFASASSTCTHICACRCVCICVSVLLLLEVCICMFVCASVHACVHARVLLCVDESPIHRHTNFRTQSREIVR